MHPPTETVEPPTETVELRPEGERASVPTISQALRLWLKVGLLSFGGPAAQIAMLHDEFVVRRRWITDPVFSRGLAVASTLPGPEAHQLATYLGLQLHGVRGGLIAGTLFVLPAVLLLLTLSSVYTTFGQLPLLQDALWGLRAAVVAVIAHAAWRVGRRTLRSPAAVALALGALLAGLLNVPFPLIVLLAALAGLLLLRSHSASDTPEPPDPLRARPTLLASAALLLAWLIPVAGLHVALGPDHLLARVALFFSTASCVTFGGAYAVLAYVSQHAVGDLGWLTPADMTAGLALAEATPGPLIIVLQFVGHLAGFRHPPAGLSPDASAVLAAAITSWTTFVPSLAFIFAAAPFVSMLTRAPRLAAALAGITAAVTGVIASLAFTLARHALFPEGLFDSRAALLVATALVLLVTGRLGLLPTLGLAAVTGLLAAP